MVRVRLGLVGWLVGFDGVQSALILLMEFLLWSDSLPLAWSVGCLSLYIVPVMMAAAPQDKVNPSYKEDRN